HHADDPCRGQPAGPPRHSDAAAESTAGGRATGGAGCDGLRAVSVALAAAHLLAVLYRPPARQLRRRHGNTAGVWIAGLPDNPARRGPTAVSDARPRRITGTRHPLAGAPGPADDGAGLGGGAAGRHADRNLVHLAP